MEKFGIVQESYSKTSFMIFPIFIIGGVVWNILGYASCKLGGLVVHGPAHT